MIFSKNHFCLFLFLIFSVATLAQSFDQHLSEIPRSKELPIIDNVTLLKKYAENNRNKQNPFRFAEPIGVQFNLIDDAKVVKNQNETLYLTRIHSEGAFSINFGFDAFQLTDGSEVYFHASDGSETFGPLTSADNEDHAQYWTQIFPYNDMVIEVNVKDGSDLPYLNLHKVNHGFTTLGSIQKSGSCNLDVICAEADGFSQNDENRDIIQSAGFYTLNGFDVCSGALINNAMQDNKPYFLTANHCGVREGNVASMVVYWNYENSFCRQPNSPASGQQGDGDLSTFNSGATLRARLALSDFCLVELDDPVNPEANAYFAGYDAQRNVATSSIAIHHPNLDEKRISYDFDPTVFVNTNDQPDPNGAYQMVEDWDIGTTEGGSSGSPLFDQNKRVVGQLYGGFAACGNDFYDVYGAMATSWEGGGSPSTRLKDWLDPSGSGTLVVDGKWANPMANPPVLSGAVASQVSCNGNMDGAIQLSATGGTPPYTFGVIGLVTNQSGLYENLGANTYECFVLDTDSLSDTIQVVLDEPSLLTLSGFGGVNMLTLSGVGGTPPFQYSIDSLNYGSDNIFDNLEPGAITAYVKDENGCIAFSMFQILEGLSIDSLITKETTCLSGNGQLSVYVSGGVPPYVFSLDGQPFVSNPVFLGLTGGEHNVIVVDTDGAQVTAQVFIADENVLQGSISFSGDTLTLNASNGIPPYLYQIDSLDFSDDSVYTSLEEGWHFYRIKDAVDCIVQDSFLIGVQLTASVNQIPCNGNTASVDLSLINGIEPIMFKMDTFLFDTIHYFENLSPGTYQFYAVDDNGQSDTFEVTIENPDELSIIHEWTANDFILHLEVSNPDLVGQYFYENDTSDNGTFYPVGPGEHIVQFTSTEGCLTQDTIVLQRNFNVWHYIEDEFCFSNNGLFAIDSIAGFYSDLEVFIDDTMNLVPIPHFRDFASAATIRVFMRDTFGMDSMDFVIERYQPDYPLSYEIINDTLKILMDSIYDIQNFTIELDGVGTSPNACFVGMPDGQYQVFLTSPGPSYCKDTLIVDYYVAVKNQEYDQVVILKPNPVQDILHLEWDEVDLDSYAIYDVLGRLVMMGPLDNYSQKNQVFIRDLDSGIYLIKMIGRNVEVHKQFIKVDG